MHRYHILSVLIFIAFCCSSCKKNNDSTDQKNTNPKLTISNISTTSGKYNTSIMITGTGFSADPSSDKVTFNGKAATVTSASITTIIATVPKGAGSGNIAVSVGNTTTTGPNFNYVYTITVSTLAGSGRDTLINGTGLNASFHGMRQIAVDSKGDIYAPDPQSRVVRKVTPDGVVTTFAGSGKLDFADGKGQAASFGTPEGVAVDSSDNVYVSDTYFKLIKKITPDGTVTTIINSKPDLRLPELISMDKHNNLFISDLDSIYKVTPEGNVSAVMNTPMNNAITFAIDANGAFYIGGGPCVYKFIPPVAQFYLYAGDEHLQGYVDGTATQARFNYISGIAFDKKGNMFVGDDNNGILREITTDGSVITIAGKLNDSYPVVDGPANVATFYSMTSLAFDSQGNLYVQDGLHAIRKVTFE